jgi:hypothetical protein
VLYSLLSASSRPLPLSLQLLLVLELANTCGDMHCASAVLLKERISQEKGGIACLMQRTIFMICLSLAQQDTN